MKNIISRLNKTQGIKGSMVVNKDGIVVASDFSGELDEVGLGAVASSILSALEGTARRIKLGKLSRFVLTGNEARMMIVDAGPALLLVLLQRDVNLGMVQVEIQEALGAIIERAKM